MKKVLALTLLLSGCGWQPPLYGQTATTESLRGDVIKLIQQDLRDKYHCDTLGMVDSVVASKTQRQVIEEWTVAACGESYTYDVVMTPNVLLPKKEGQTTPRRGTAVQIIDLSAPRK